MQSNTHTKYLNVTSVVTAVFMGMGEPLLNLPNVVAAVAMLQQQLGLSGRAVTISTVGVPNAINR
jgi:23S rRNA (adenine2503-C2)-methyltransferase